MTLGYISIEQLPVFSPFMDPQVVAALKEGEPITALGIVKGETACGALAGYIDEEHFQITSLYVAPAFRRQGGATMMLNGLKRILYEYSSIEKIMIDYTVTHEEHETLMPFLDASDFTTEQNDGLTLYRFPLEKVLHSPLFTASTLESSHLLAFSRISDDLLMTAQKTASVQDVPLPEVPLTSNELDRELSHAYIKNGEIEAFITFDHSYGNMLTLSCAWVDKAQPAILAALLRKSLQRANELYSPDTMIAVQPVNEASAKLIHNLVPDAECISFTCSTRLY